ncbi:MAG: glycosyltransferase family 9 protein [Armatimonadota bacterium]
MKPKPDCVEYRGDRPCRHDRLCPDCPHYRPVGVRVLIVKLSHRGDVLRTTPLLRGLRRYYPDVHITWLTDSDAADLLRDNDHINVLLEYDLRSLVALHAQRFDILISLDKEPHAAALARLVPAEKRLGFGLHETGRPEPLGPSAEYAFALGLSDDLKFRENTKTYRELIFDIAEIPYERDEYLLSVTPESVEWATRWLESAEAAGERPLIAVAPSAGQMWPTKAWPVENCAAFVRTLAQGSATSGTAIGKVVLVGAPDEQERNRDIAARSESHPLDATGQTTIPQLCGLISLCDAVVTTDTLAMHVGIALRKPVVALFGPTCPQEVDLYDRGAKLTPMADCAPCYRGTCDDLCCMAEHSAESVLEALAAAMTNERSRPPKAGSDA